MPGDKMNNRSLTLAEELNQAIRAGTTMEDSLNRAFAFLSRLFPLDLLTFSRNQRDKGLLHYIVHVSREGVWFVDEKIHLSGPALAESMRNRDKKLVFFNNNSPLVQDLSVILNIKTEASNMSLNIGSDSDYTYSIGLTIFKNDAYRQEHADLLIGLNETLATHGRSLLQHLKLQTQNERLAAANREFLRRLGYLVEEQVIGAGSGLKDVMAMAMKVARLDSPVLIMGETGSGKEVVANAIHRASRRIEGPFVSVNCGAIPETLLDSELFGHEKGSFTGATGLKRGFFEQADGGTIFLDEVGELPRQAQVRLLRVLQNMEFQRVGGSRSITVDVRVIAATNRNLPEMVKEGTFREDLWFRLNVFPIWVPPLRQRREDIPLLAESFLARKTRELNLGRKPLLGQAALGQLRDYDWPGNVRELQNVIERALIISQGDHLVIPPLGRRPVSPPVEPLSPPAPDSFPPLDQVVSGHIRQALDMTKGRINGPGGAAELLGLNPSTLRGKMKKLGLRITRTVGRD